MLLAHHPAEETLEMRDRLDALELKRCGLEKNPRGSFFSDNGPANTSGPEARGEPDVWRSCCSVGERRGMCGLRLSFYGGGGRVAFIERCSGNMPESVKNDTTALTAVDLLPAFYTGAGINPPEDAKGGGESVLEALVGKPVLRTRSIFWRNKADDSAIRVGNCN